MTKKNALKKFEFENFFSGKVVATGYMCFFYPRIRKKIDKFFNNYRRFWRPQFKVALPDTDNQWVEKTLNFSDFKKMRFDEVLGGGPSTNELSNVIRLGFISNEKKASPYVFEVASIEFL